MLSASLIVFGCIGVMYCVFRFLLALTQDTIEPRTLKHELPFFGPLISMIKGGPLVFIKLRDECELPIYTLRLPFFRMYVINSTDLMPALQKKWRTISFAPIVAASGPMLMGIGEDGSEILHKDITSDSSYVASFARATTSVLAPGSIVDDISRRAVEIVLGATERLLHSTDPTIQSKVVEFWSWTHHEILMATTEAVYGPGNPYRDTDLKKAWNEFERSYLMLGLSPFKSLLAPKALRNREAITAAWTNFIRNGSHSQASEFAKAMHEHDKGFGFKIQDLARTEIGHSFAMLGSTAPAAWWMMYHIFSDPAVLADVREELDSLTHLQNTGDETWKIDLSKIQTKCPILLSVFKETLRYRSLGVQVRMCLEDDKVNGYLLKKGAMVIIPQNVQHTSIDAWGPTAKVFDHLRFVKASDGKKINHTAFRAFGGGHTMCPGRHFSTIQILAFAAIMVLQFDITPVDDQLRETEWKEPKWVKTPAVATFPVPDKEFKVSVRPRDARRWNIEFAGKGDAHGNGTQSTEESIGEI